MNDILPTSVNDFLEAYTSKISPTLADVYRIIFFVHHPYHDRQTVGKVSEPLFTFLQDVFGVLALGDICKVNNQSIYRRMMIQIIRSNQHPQPFVLLRSEADFEIRTFYITYPVVERINRNGYVFRMHKFEAAFAYHF